MYLYKLNQTNHNTYALFNNMISKAEKIKIIFKKNFEFYMADKVKLRFFLLTERND